MRDKIIANKGVLRKTRLQGKGEFTFFGVSLGLDRLSKARVAKS